MSDDPIVAEVRAIREKRAARFSFDIDAIVEDAMKRQGKDGCKVISRAARRPRKRGSDNACVVGAPSAHRPVVSP
jgi:transposase